MKIKNASRSEVLETSKTNPRYHSNCGITTTPPPLRSPTTSMHERSIHGKRLLGDWPLGLPAQKGWEILLFLIGLPPSPTLWKIPAGSVFIDAFVNRLLNCPYFTTLQQWCQCNRCTKKWTKNSCVVHKCVLIADGGYEKGGAVTSGPGWTAPCQVDRKITKIK